MKRIEQLITGYKKKHGERVCPEYISVVNKKLGWQDVWSIEGKRWYKHQVMKAVCKHCGVDARTHRIGICKEGWRDKLVRDIDSQ